MEILRDLLDAASRAHRKTRIIGIANLNQESFQRYSALAVSAGLLRHQDGHYATTPHAKEWLRAVDSVLRKGTEVSSALASLSRLTRQTVRSGAASPEESGEVARQLLGRLAWAELGVLEEERAPSAPAAPEVLITAHRPLGATIDGSWPGRAAAPVPSDRRSR